MLGYVFPKELGLDSISTSWDLKIRIPRRKLRMQSYSQVCRSNSRSKYLKIDVLICFFYQIMGLVIDVVFRYHSIGEVPGSVEMVPTSLPELPKPSRTPGKSQEPPF